MTCYRRSGISDQISPGLPGPPLTGSPLLAGPLAYLLFPHRYGTSAPGPRIIKARPPSPNTVRARTEPRLPADGDGDPVSLIWQAALRSPPGSIHSAEQWDESRHCFATCAPVRWTNE